MARFFAVLAVFLIAHVIPAMPASRRVQPSNDCDRRTAT